MQVTARARSAQVGHAAAAQPDLGARLGARLDLDLLCAGSRRHRHPRAQRGLGDRQRELVEELGLAPLQLGMWLDVDDDVQVARDPSPGRGLTLAGEAHLVALGDARRDGHAQGALALDATVATTRVTR